MRKINKTAILLVCTLLFTGCGKKEGSFLDYTLTDSKLYAFEHLTELQLTDQQYRKLTEEELDIGIDSTEYKVRSGFYSNEDVFYVEPSFHNAINRMYITWPRAFSVPYNDERRYGYIDEDSDIIIQPKYVDAVNFYDGVALAYFTYMSTSPTDKRTDFKFNYQSKDWVYIDESGLIIEALADYNGDKFLDGTAGVTRRKDKYGVNRFEVYTNGEKLYNGKKNVERLVDKGHRLGDLHLRSVKDYNILMDETGEIIIDTDEKYFDFEGAGNDYVYGIKSFTGKNVKDLTVEAPSSTYDMKFVVLDTKGNVISEWLDYDIRDQLIMNRYMYDTEVNDGLILIFDTTTEKFGYLSITGEITIEPIYTSASIFSEGLACVSDGENYGFINTNGELVIPMKYPILNENEIIYDYKVEMPTNMIFKELKPLLQYSRFTEGVCPVRENGKFGFINKSGEYVVEPIFDELSNVNEGIATGKIGNNYYVIEKINN